MLKTNKTKLLVIGGEPVGLVGTKLVNSFNGYFL